MKRIAQIDAGGGTPQCHMVPGGGVPPAPDRQRRRRAIAARWWVGVWSLASVGCAVGSGWAQPPGAAVPREAASTKPLAREVRQISESMQEVRRRLEQGQVSAPTQLRQQQVMSALDVLIKQLTPPAGDAQSAASATDTARGKGPSSPTKATGRQAARQAGATTGSTGQVDPAMSVREGLPRVWGQLPLRLRKQMQNVADIEFLPMYRQLIEDYYRRLAEEDR